VGHPQTAKLQKTPPSEVLDVQASQNVPYVPLCSVIIKKVFHFFVKLYEFVVKRGLRLSAKKRRDDWIQNFGGGSGGSGSTAKRKMRFRFP
jgi:hypothetical protein